MEQAKEMKNNSSDFLRVTVHDNLAEGDSGKQLQDKIDVSKVIMTDTGKEVTNVRDWEHGNGGFEDRLIGKVDEGDRGKEREEGSRLVKVYEESFEGEISSLEAQNQVMPMLLELADPEVQELMMTELVNIPIVISNRKDILRDRDNNILRQQGEESQLCEKRSSKKWKRLKGKENAIIIRDGLQKESKTTEGKKR